MMRVSPMMRPQRRRRFLGFASIFFALLFLLLHPRHSPPTALQLPPTAAVRPISANALAKDHVLVTGASGKTGSLVVETLLRHNYSVTGFVRDERKGQILRSKYGQQGLDVMVGDVLQPVALAPALEGCRALVIVTSAVPKVKPLSVVAALLGRILPASYRPKVRFSWKAGLKPEEVDWHGQRNQIDAAIAAGVDRIVLVSSMGGTQPGHFLNRIGDGEGDRILDWKRRAEQYLIDRCSGTSTSYTIVHAGGLLDKPGGERAWLLGVDDELLETPYRTVPRADIADACVQALSCAAAADRSFDMVASPSGLRDETKHRADLSSLLDQLNGANTDYSINPV